MTGHGGEWFSLTNLYQGVMDAMKSKFAHFKTDIISIFDQHTDMMHYLGIWNLVLDGLLVTVETAFEAGVRQLQSARATVVISKLANHTSTQRTRPLVHTLHVTDTHVKIVREEGIALTSGKL